MMFGTPMTVSAEPTINPDTGLKTYQIDQDPAIITAAECEAGCKGHLIQGKTGAGGTGAANVIRIDGGTHTVILDNVEIDASSGANNCAFEINPAMKSDVKLILQGKNVLKSGGASAGIRVKGNSSIRIQDSEDSPENNPGTLEVTGGVDGGAGIGGDMLGGTAGSITIDSGNITAKGGKNGAGIGGSNESSAGNIVINGGKINATGGSNQADKSVGAPGIGSGANAKPGERGSVEVNGGEVTSKGGTGKQWDPQVKPDGGVYVVVPASGIVCDKLSSHKLEGEETMAAVEMHTSLDVKDTSQFNGIVWTSDSNCEVYGYVDLGENLTDIRVKTNQVMNIRDGSCLVVPDKWKVDGIVKGAGTLIGGNGVDTSSGGSVSGVKNKEAQLTGAAIFVSKNETYSGKNLQDTVVQIKQSGETINQKNWNIKIIKDGTEAKEIKNVGKYEITYVNAITGAVIKPSNNNTNVCEITAARMGEVKPDTLTDKPYTGSAIMPEPELTYNNNSIKLTKGVDYEDPVQYGENIKLGEGTITVKGKGNFAGTKTINFKIVPAPLNGEEMAVNLLQTEFTYNGEVQTPEVEVLKGDTKLVLDTDYTVKYDPQNPKDAGTVRAIVEGKGNYGGKVEKEFTIQPRSLKLLSAEAVGRDYNKKNEVEIKSVELAGDNMLEQDKEFVYPKSGLKATIASPDAGAYSEVTFTEVALDGTKAKNYKVDFSENEGRVPVKNADGTTNVIISKAECKEKPDIKASYDISPTSPTNKFMCVLTPEKAEYEYSIDSNAENAGWQKGNGRFDGIDPGKKRKFYARVAETDNYLAGPATELEVDFKLKEREAPKSFKLSFTLNDDGKTFTATIPPVADPDAVYSFDGENFNVTNMKPDCQPGTEYTGYVKYMANTLYDESEAVSDTQTSPKLIVETPVIDPNGGKFLTTQTVTISCETDDAKIYYTTDGKNPTTESTEYKEPFELKSSATVKAIAVKKGMDDSTMASATFVQGNSVETKLDIQPNIKPENITPGLAATEFNTPEAIQTKFSSVLTAMEGYNYLNIAYYDITLWLSPDGEKWEQATVDNFPKEGLLVTLPYPIGTSKDTHDFVVSHMFGADSTRLGLSAGQTEEPTVKKEKDGLTFTVKSTSPIAVAWKNIKEGEQTPPGDDNNQPGGTDNNNQNNQNGQDNNNQNGQDNQNNQNNQNGQDNQNNQGGQNQNNQNGQDNQNNKNNQNNNGNSQNNGSQNGTANNGNTGSDNTKGTNGTNANGTNANGTNADGTKTATSGTSTTAGNDNKGGISSVLPKTGDTASILLWAAGMGIGLLAIIMIIVKKKKK